MDRKTERLTCDTHVGKKVSTKFPTVITNTSEIQLFLTYFCDDSSLRIWLSMGIHVFTMVLDLFDTSTLSSKNTSKVSNLLFSDSEHCKRFQYTYITTALNL